jgi:glycosyltransferase involved in cell wall biosynthesis
MTDCRIICFAGGFFDAPIWTNRQNIMSRVAKHHPVLYVEPRVWIFRYLWDNRSNPARIFHFFMRVVWYEQITDYQPPIARTLFIKSQWNLIPGSRENKAIAWFNHYILNRWNVLLTARFLGFRQPITDDRLPISNITWIYDTEAAEYLDSCKTTRVIYDCVDDHAVQAGPDRNPERVREEEAAIMHRADLITVTSRKLYEDKKHQNANVHLVLNAGDVELFSRSNPSPLPFVQGGPIIGTVGTLDSYKYDFDLIYAVAQRKPDWQFVFIGQPIVSKYSKNSEYNKYSIDDLEQLPNIHILANIPRQQVPTYVQQFDICMIPYRASVYNAASFPLKFWEFMASGKPIVFSGLPELELYATNGPEGIPGVVSTIDASSFIQKTAQLLVSKERGSAARRTEAGRHSWEQRTQLLLKLLSQLP